MTGLVIIVAVTALLGLVLWAFDRRRKCRGRYDVVVSEAPQQPAEVAKESAPEEPQAKEQCCGMHIVCEKDSLMPLSTDIEYYDDEELDRYAGREADAYADSEIEEWRDILLTLRPEEIAGWARSVQLRGITMPSPIRDELLLIVSEARASRT